MNITYLKEFIAFSKRLNYAKAAKDLYISQPTLRSHIRSLETCVGGPLVAKRGDTLGLTLAGRQFLKRSRELVSMAESMLDECRELALNSASLQVGFLDCPWIEDMFLRAREVYTDMHPDFSLELLFSSQMNANEESINEGLADISIYPLLRDPDRSDEINEACLTPGHSSIYIGTYDLLFWMTERCGLYDQEQVYLKDAAHKTLMLGNTSNMTNAAEKFERYFSARGVEIDVDTQPYSSFADYYLSNEEDAFGIIMDRHRFEHRSREGFRVFAFEDFQVQSDLYVMYDIKRIESQAPGFVDVLQHVIDLELSCRQ